MFPFPAVRAEMVEFLNKPLLVRHCFVTLFLSYFKPVEAFKRCPSCSKQTAQKQQQQSPLKRENTTLSKIHVDLSGGKIEGT